MKNFLPRLMLWAALLMICPGDVHSAEQFYEGKTIQLLVASGPGATTDFGARLVGRFLGKYIPGNPSAARVLRELVKNQRLG